MNTAHTLPPHWRNAVHCGATGSGVEAPPRLGDDDSAARRIRKTEDVPPVIMRGSVATSFSSSAHFHSPSRPCLTPRIVRLRRSTLSIVTRVLSAVLCLVAVPLAEGESLTVSPSGAIPGRDAQPNAIVKHASGAYEDSGTAFHGVAYHLPVGNCRPIPGMGSDRAKREESAMVEAQLQNLFVKALPDPRSPYHRHATTESVSDAVLNGSAEVLRHVSTSAAEADLAVTVFYVLQPGTGQTTDKRLRIGVCIRGADQEETVAISRLIRQGTLGLLFPFEVDPGFEFPLQGLQVASFIARPGSVVPAGVDRGDNPHVVEEGYCCFGEMKGRNRCNFVTLDRVLSSLDETVVAAVTVARADVAGSVEPLRKYVSRLGEALHPSRLDALGEMDTLLRGADRLSAYERPVTVPIKRDTVAEAPERCARDLLRALSEPCLRFGAYVLAEQTSTARLVARVLAEGRLDAGSYRLGKLDEPAAVERLSDSLRRGHPHSTPSLGTLYEGRVPDCCASLEPLTQIATVKELASLFALPVAGYGPTLTIGKESDPLPVAPERMCAIGRDWHPGAPVDETRLSVRGVKTTDMSRHTAVFGMSGYSKTTLALAVVLDALKKDIPVLVLECAKREFRSLLRLRDHEDPALRDLGRRVRLYSPSLSQFPYRRNVFVRSTGVTPDEQAEAVLTILKATNPLEGPLLPLLMASLHRLIERFDKQGRTPTFDDLLLEYEAVVRSKHYAPEMESDILAAGRARLYLFLLGRSGDAYRTLFNVPQLDPIPKGCYIVELEGLSREQACLEALSVLTDIRQTASATPHSGEHPRCLILIEEAHVIVPAQTGRAESRADAPDTAAFAVELVTRLLAEGRALGLALWILDQHPSAVAPAVLKGVASVVATRQRDREDVERIAHTMLLSVDEQDEMVRFGKGDCFFQTDGYVFARRLRLANTKAELGLEASPSDADALSLVEEDEGYRLDVERSITGLLAACEQRVDQTREFLDSTKATLSASKDRSAPRAELERTLAEIEEQRSLAHHWLTAVTRLAIPPWVDSTYLESRKMLMQRCVDVEDGLVGCIRTIRIELRKNT